MFFVYNFREMVTNYRSQVAQKHSKALRDQIKFAENFDKTTALEAGIAWKGWSNKKATETFAKLKKDITFEYPRTRM